jgi:hypothetical protein
MWLLALSEALPLDSVTPTDTVVVGAQVPPRTQSLCHIRNLDSGPAALVSDRAKDRCYGPAAER